MGEIACFNCSFPIATEGKIEAPVKCPYCGAHGIITEEVNMRSRPSTSNEVVASIASPGPGFWEFFLGLVIGVIFAPPIISATAAGRKYLASVIERKLR
jgi:DNA-directed RNA polymerase subunit RPC12/RpoP